MPGGHVKNVGFRFLRVHGRSPKIRKGADGYDRGSEDQRTRGREGGEALRSAPLRRPVPGQTGFTLKRNPGDPGLVIPADATEGAAPNLTVARLSRQSRPSSAE